MSVAGRPRFQRGDKSFLQAHKWLLLRRASQLIILGLFILGPVASVWILKGNLSASMLLDTVPMNDPYMLLQVILTGHMPELISLVGAAIILTFYFLVGGRSYCGWVCPINIVSDSANWLHYRLNLHTKSMPNRNLRYWLLAVTLLLALLSGSLLWELVNPVTMIQRGLIYGSSTVWFAILALFLFELLVSQRGWCGHLCPTGAFYSLLSYRAPIRVQADRREQCDDCASCYAVCIEPQIIKLPLKGADKGVGPLIDSAVCSNCGRCVDICPQDVFHFTNRFHNEKSRDGVTATPKIKETTP
ncbi:quinol dehydrogenase ferredoxin subunit NapH [Pseudomonadota bacterium]